MLDDIESDVIIIQESENPELFINELNRENLNFIWIGEKHKGLAILYNKELSFSPITLENHLLKYFVFINLNGLKICAVWAMPNYIEDMNVFFSIHNKELEDNDLIIGDFNSSAIWDNPKRIRTGRGFANLVNKLNSYKFESLYHKEYKEDFGLESKETFRLHHNKNKPYHIDYAFLRKKYNCVFEILNTETFFNYSDHCPLLVEIINYD